MFAMLPSSDAIMKAHQGLARVCPNIKTPEQRESDPTLELSHHVHERGSACGFGICRAIDGPGLVFIRVPCIGRSEVALAGHVIPNKLIGVPLVVASGTHACALRCQLPHKVEVFVVDTTRLTLGSNFRPLNSSESASGFTCQPWEQKSLSNTL